jgi:hypothetical protein
VKPSLITPVNIQARLCREDLLAAIEAIAIVAAGMPDAPSLNGTP